MKNIRLVLGPPGTGKTTRLLDLLVQEVREGTPLARIAFVTFGRKASQEVVDRIRDEGLFPLDGDSRKTLPWFRTIHATAFALLGFTRDQVMDFKKWKAFASEYSYCFSGGSVNFDETIQQMPGKTDDDKSRAAVDWGRSRMLDLRDKSTWFDFYEYGLSFGKHELNMLDNLTKFKQTHRYIDFYDMLERALSSASRPPVDVAFVDEAQDLSPLQVRLVEKWFGTCSRVYVAGDDDQAIYGFQGADPEWLLSLHDRAVETEILAQSYRVPQAVHEIATCIISRNRDRVVKAYKPTDALGTVIRSNWPMIIRSLPQWEQEHESVLVLFRNQFFLKRIAAELEACGQPFVSSKHDSDTKDLAYMEAVQTGIDLLAGKPVFAKEFAQLVWYMDEDDGLVTWASVINQSPLRREGSDLVLVAAERIGNRMWLGSGPRLLKKLSDTDVPAALKRLSRKEKTFARQCVARYGHCTTQVKVELSTIHAAKGREADLVVVSPDLTKATHESLRSHGYESENRVAYVAVTRARKQLVLAYPSRTWAYPYPSTS